MDDSDAAVTRATEILLQQDGYQRQLAQRLQQQQSQIGDLQSQLTALAAAQGTTPAVKAPEDADGAARLRAANRALADRVRILETDLQAVDADQSRFHDSGRASESGRWPRRPPARPPNPDPWGSDGADAVPDRSPGARRVLAVLSTAVAQWEFVRLDDDDEVPAAGLARAAEVWCQTLAAVWDAAAAAADPIIQAEGAAWRLRLQGAQLRFLEGLHAARTDHRRLRRSLHDAAAQHQQLAVELEDARHRLAALQQHHEEFAVQQQRLGWELQQRIGSLQEEAALRLVRIRDLERTHRDNVAALAAADEWRLKSEQCHSREAGLKAQLHAADAELAAARAALATLRSERAVVPRDRDREGSALYLAPGPPPDHWREAFLSIAHFCEDIRTVVQLGVATLAGHMGARAMVQLQLPPSAALDHATITRPQLTALCRSVHDLVRGYIETVNAFAGSLTADLQAAKVKALDRRKQAPAILRLFVQAGALRRDQADLKRSVTATLGDGRRVITEASQAAAAALQSVGTAPSSEEQWAQRVRELEDRLQIAIGRHAEEARGEFERRLEASQVSFLDADALNRTALEADHRLRRDLDARTQDAAEMARQLEEHRRLHEAELAAGHEAHAALLRQLCLAERKNGELHLKCVAREEECLRLSAALKPSRRTGASSSSLSLNTTAIDPPNAPHPPPPRWVTPTRPPAPGDG